jgi:hypothetical protein
VQVAEVDANMLDGWLSERETRPILDSVILLSGRLSISAAWHESLTFDELVQKKSAMPFPLSDSMLSNFTAEEFPIG